MPLHTSIVPLLRYLDAPAAIEWLCRVFGFERRLVVPGEGGTIRHAQLTLGDGMIMLGSVREGELPRSPKELGAVTQAIYAIVPEIDAHYERAIAAGAEILSPIEDPPHGGRLYSARDLEGHVWNFGSYDPWAS